MQPLKVPPWSLNENSSNVSLSELPKVNTPPKVYQARFLELINAFKNHNLIFTDGSKHQSNIAYSITTKSEIINQSLVPQYSSIYSAIYKALLLIVSRSGNFAICSDSLSAIKSIRSIENTTFYAQAVRDILIKHHTKFTIIWTPGHSQIEGNELADTAAREALNRPLEISENYNTKDINSHIKNIFKQKKLDKLTDTSTWYRSHNSSGCRLKDFPCLKSSGISRFLLTKYIRLRLGHTQISQLSLFEPEAPSICYYCRCNSEMSIAHLLKDCTNFRIQRTQIFKNKNPINCIFETNVENISLVIKFLKDTDLIKMI